MKHLRHLDFDDLIVMKMLLSAEKLKDISAALGITPPALSHRLKKYRACLPEFDIKATSQGKWEMSEEAKKYCVRAAHAIDAFFSEPEIKVEGQQVNG